MTPRLTGLACVAALLTWTPAASATSYRTSSATYIAPGGSTLGVAGTVSTLTSPALTDRARNGEDRVTVSVTDSLSAAVAMAVDVTPAGGSKAARTIGCSVVTVPVRSGSTVSVTPLTGRCADGRLSTPRTGRISLSYRRPSVAAPRPAVPRKGVATPEQRFALVVGIKDYAGSTHDTIGGEGDVLAVRRALIGAGWRNDHILTIRDNQATAAGIRAGLDWLKARSSPKTFSLFHYSGHVCIASRGPCASGHAYLWSHDNRMISETEVVSRMKQVQGRQWMDMSACEGGAFDAGYSSPTRLFTGASQGDETAYEEPRWNESVWSGLTWDIGYNKGLADPQGKAMHATIAQMASYGVREAAIYTRNQTRGVQHPVLAGGDRTWSLTAPPGG